MSNLLSIHHAAHLPTPCPWEFQVERLCLQLFIAQSLEWRSQKHTSLLFPISADSLGDFVEVTVRDQGGASKSLGFNGSNTCSDGEEKRGWWRGFMLHIYSVAFSFPIRVDAGPQVIWEQLDRRLATNPFPIMTEEIKLKSARQQGGSDLWPLNHSLSHPVQSVASLKWSMWFSFLF